MIYHGFDMLDLGGPLAVFHHAELMRPGSYALSVASVQGGPISSSSSTTVLSEPIAAALDTLIVVGGKAAKTEDRSNLIRCIRSIEARRTTSVCTGALLLAEAGLLDCRTVTTHWLVASELRDRYPTIRVEDDLIYVRDGPIWTSAGISAGIDMCLALVEEDFGTDLSKSVARMLVVYHRRSGSQRQYSSLLDLDPVSDRIRLVLGFARDHLHSSLSVEQLAGVAKLSVRQFSRAFLASTGVTPAKAIERMRVEAARVRLEDGSETLGDVARAVGFSGPDRMRQSFKRVLGQVPTNSKSSKIKSRPKA
ncbi:GlxA family transcriptional regulator [Bradyrhizobium tropiciagri]|uniref:GlxA family transcriptional regulator n=1 Tax=Bradyrhizobium tropiciagri TaxID=312253 RepID=UPI0020134AFA|nr:DJ-1/PfpI family protein [Bradyrhizobium tropiciagri]